MPRTAMIASAQPAPSPKGRPRILVALVAAAIVASVRRDWLSAPVATLAEEVSVSACRVSRAKSKVEPAFEAALQRATMRGRPPSPVGHEQELELHKELQAIGATLVRAAGVHPKLHGQVVAAYERLHARYGLTLKGFCERVGIPERTLRDWRRRAALPAPVVAPAPSPSVPPARRPARNVGRFALSQTLPGIQAMGDTSDWKVFGVQLKIIAVQDPGDRDVHLWEDFSVEDHEDSDVIVQTVTKALADSPGTQWISDQGRPYLAEAAREAYEQLQLDHQPAKEYTPTEKATLERSFGMVKQALAPLTSVLNRLAQAVPALRDSGLAKAAGSLLLATYLHVYATVASRPDPERLPANRPYLEALAQEQREHACAEDRSRRLFLETMHEQYAFPQSREAFVRAYRNAALEDLKEAEHRFRSYSCRCQAHNCDRYFAAVFRDVQEQGRARRGLERQECMRGARSSQEREDILAQSRYLDDHPEDAIQVGLDGIAQQWQPATHTLLAHGHGPGRACLSRGLAALTAQAPLPLDAAAAAWGRWEATRQDLEPTARQAVKAVFDDLLGELDRQRTLTSETQRSTIGALARGSRNRSSPVPGLRNYPASGPGS